MVDIVHPRQRFQKWDSNSGTVQIDLEHHSTKSSTRVQFLLLLHHYQQSSNMQVHEPALASSSKTKTTYITEPSYTDVTRQQPFNYRSLPSHDPAICIDAGMFRLPLEWAFSSSEQDLQHGELGSRQCLTLMSTGQM
jgi:hypothetical protein